MANAEKKEKKFLLQEFNILKNLQQAIDSKNIEKARKIGKTIGALAYDIEKVHKDALSHITVLIEHDEDLKKEVKSLEAKIQPLYESLIERLDISRGTLYPMLMQEKPDLNSIKLQIQDAESKIMQWLQLLEQLEQIEINKREYKKVLVAFQEKMVDLLKGKGKYENLSLYQRRKLWNRWTRVSTQRILKDVNLSGLDLNNFNFSNFIFKGKINLSRSNLDGAYLREADLEGANLDGAHLRGADLERANLRGAHFEGANLYGANLVEAYLVEAYLGGADLERANLGGANLERADLEGANLARANMGVADLGGANLEGANLRGAHLEGAYLRGAYLRGAHLVEAYLGRADLTGANLVEANLGGADIRGADLEGANLYRADFKNAKNCLLSKEELKKRGARY